MANNRGRPSGPSTARSQLIEAAKQLFTALHYDKVSTRMVAEKAGVNAAMIRYYFSNKQGLFRTMLEETMAPMLEAMTQARVGDDFESQVNVLRTYYRVMGQNPDFPKLIYRILTLEQDSPLFLMFMERVQQVIGSSDSMLFDALERKGELKPGVEAAIARVSFFSLMIFPFLAPPQMLALHGAKLDPDFLDRLAEHNVAMLKAGMLANTGEHK